MMFTGLASELAAAVGEMRSARLPLCTWTTTYELLIACYWAFPFELSRGSKFVTDDCYWVCPGPPSLFLQVLTWIEQKLSFFLSLFWMKLRSSLIAWLS